MQRTDFDLNKQHSLCSDGRRPRIFAKAGDARPLSLTVRAEGDRAVIEIEGEIESYWNNAQDFKSKITDALAKGLKNVHVYINSVGGNVFEAAEIVNQIKRFEGTITGEGGAVVASAGTAIAIEIPGFTMAENGSFMIHKPMMGTYGTADEIESNLKLLKDLTASYLKKYAEKSGKSEADIKAIWDKGDWWMTAQEALDEGFIDGITGATEITPELAEQLTAKGALHVVATAKPKATPTPTSKSNNPHNVKELQILALSMGLTEDANLAEIKAEFAKVKALADRATKAEKDLKDYKDAEAVKAKAEAKKKFDVAFDAKVTAKAITEDYRAGFQAKFEINPEATLAEVEALKPVPNVSEQLPNGGGDTTEGGEGFKTYAEYQEKNPKALYAMAKNEPAKLKALFEAQFSKELSDEAVTQMASQA